MNRLNEIEARANAATEGPWNVFMGRIDHPGRSLVAVAYDVGCDEDAEFIAHARTDVPWLLEQVDRRDKALEKMLRLHPRVVVLHADPEFGRIEDDAICGACIVNHEPADWPCPTVEAITTALEGETND